MSTQYATYKWEAIPVTTQDKYELTLFHVWNADKRTELGVQGPILFQHGTGQDGTGFLQMGANELNPGTAMPIQFADLGYDVYIGNNRGTEYSRGHTDLDSPAENPAVYWDFTIDGFALDLLAQSKAMTENADSGKGWYVGYSQGTIQALVALSKYEAVVNAYINRVVLLAPCFGYLASGASKSSTTGNELYSAGYIKNALNGIGIYASGDTTTWEADVAKICAELSSDLCAWAQG